MPVNALGPVRIIISPCNVTIYKRQCLWKLTNANKALHGSASGIRVSHAQLDMSILVGPLSGALVAGGVSIEYNSDLTVTYEYDLCLGLLWFLCHDAIQASHHSLGIMRFLLTFGTLVLKGTKTSM